jgi:hypothetical protein
MDLFNSLDQQMQEGRKEKRKRNHLLSYNLLALDQSSLLEAVAIQEMKMLERGQHFPWQEF